MQKVLHLETSGWSRNAPGVLAVLLGVSFAILTLSEAPLQLGKNAKNLARESP